VARSSAEAGRRGAGAAGAATVCAGAVWASTGRAIDHAAAMRIELLTPFSDMGRTDPDVCPLKNRRFASSIG
jgi:hypothetical protein